MFRAAVACGEPFRQGDAPVGDAPAGGRRLFAADDRAMLAAVGGLVDRGVTLKSALLEWTARRRRLPTRRLDTNLLEVDGRLLFCNMNGPSSSVGGRMICDRKDVARDCVSELGYPVVPFRCFAAGDGHRALDFAREIGFPVVVKPRSAARGRGVTTGIGTGGMFRDAWRKAGLDGRSARIIVEKHFFGDDYRAFAVDGQVVSVTRYAPANITGDGHSTVHALIREKNAARAQNPYLRGYPIAETAGCLDGLTGSGRRLDDRPAAGEVVILRTVPNLSAGGDSIDVTEAIHPSYRQVAAALSCSIPGLRYLGIDFLSRDIRAPALPGHYVVSEIEFSPAPLAHFPALGQARDMAGAVLDFYRPE